jgi:C-terminal processing protease CtpA/Prc
MTMLQNSRSWWRAAAGGVLGAAVLLSGNCLRAAAADDPPRTDQPRKEQPKADDSKKDEPRKEQPRADDTRRDDSRKGATREDEGRRDESRGDQDIQKQLDQMRREMDEMRRFMDQARRAMPGMLGGPATIPGSPPGFPGSIGRFAGQGRLGVGVGVPDETLAEQLDLKRGQGLVVRSVERDSPAEKAGIKPNDVLVEVNGKPVPNDVGELARMLSDAKPDAGVDVTVIRKGKPETLKGIKLREVPPEGGLRPPRDRDGERPPARRR